MHRETTWGMRRKIRKTEKFTRPFPKLVGVFSTRPGPCGFADLRFWQKSTHPGSRVPAKFKVVQHFSASVAEGPAALVAAVGLDNLAEPYGYVFHF